MKLLKKSLAFFLSAIILLSSFTAFAADYKPGIDVSKHNGTVDYVTEVANGTEFVMIRLGYYNHIDEKFWDNVKAACDAGMQFGVYLYSYAFDLEEAQIEADFTIETLSEMPNEYSKYFTMPVALDMEDAKLVDFSKDQLTQQTVLYCDAIAEEGYTPMVYANLNWFTKHLDINTFADKGYKLWYAKWEDSPDFSTQKQIGNTGIYADIWQYCSGDDHSSGIDRNIAYPTVNETNHNDFEYSVDSKGNVTITDYVGESKEVVIPSKIEGKTVKYLDSYAFYIDCLVSIVLPESIEQIAYYALGCNDFTSITIPKNVKNIDVYAFGQCYKLEEFVVDSENKYYSSVDGVLFNNDKTTLVACPSSLNKYGEYVIPSTVKTIGANAFENSYLSKVSIPNSVTKISDNAFNNAYELKELELSANVEYIGKVAFADCYYLKQITVDENNKNYSSENGVLFNKDKTELIQFPIGSDQTDYTIPDGVITLCDYSFASCSLESVKFSDSIKNILEAAFHCAFDLTEIQLPSSLEFIDDAAFIYCKNVESVTIPSSVSEIGDNAFYGWDALKTVNYRGSEKEWKKIVIGESNDAFENDQVEWHYNYCAENKTHSLVKGDTIAPTCTKKGYTTYICSDCGYSCADDYTEATGHSYKTKTTKATLSKNGKIEKTCSECGYKTSTTIYYPKTISLSATSYTYNGNVRKPSVTVKDSKGNKISSKYYTVSYASGRKNVGKYSVKITFKGNYSGTKTLYFTIKPKSTSISSLTAKSKGFTVKWKKQSTQVSGYQIQYSTSSKFTSAKTVTVSGTSTTSKSISNLSKKKKYYVRVRTYKTVNGTKYYSSWSGAKSVKTK